MTEPPESPSDGAPAPGGRREAPDATLDFNRDQVLPGAGGPASLDSGVRAAEPPSSGAVRAPAGWDRYEILGVVGEGGMGAVYKARDPRLGRFVALKFLRGNDPSLIEHFSREAQAQARVDHNNICKVYEVGEAGDQPFIAMQFIDGESIGEAMHSMSLEQRVAAVRDVAEGLHEAHRLGLIHRDVKPANILVERLPDGGFHPYLVDFGLAREMKGDGQTIFSVEGTPCYMSPEQVAGDLRRLDRRTDVYGLGATLYELLAGVPPFAGHAPLDVIWMVRAEQPKSVREIDGRIPVDLETIVLKCIEKEPQRRYDSARALAEDLQRYLDGDPIRARRAGWVYHLWKKGQKHKLGVALAAAAVLALLIVGGVAVRARIAAAEQSERAREVGVLAQELGQDVKEMELFMQYAYALPLHDITREREVIRARLRAIERRIDASRSQLGSLAEGPGRYALGRGFLALGELDGAVHHLEAALSQGYTAPEASLAAGRARGILYARTVDHASRLPTREAREAFLQTAKREHLEPALRYLRESTRESSEAPHLTLALIALYEGRLDDALAEAGRASAEAPWSYEAKKVEADVLRSRAAAAEERSEHVQALADLRVALARYREAAEMATSDPLVHDAQAEAWLGVMRIDRDRGADLRESYEEAVRSCGHAITADPRQSSAYTKEAWAHVHYATSLAARGTDPRDILARAVRAGEAAIRSAGPNALAYNSIGASYWIRALYESSIGQDESDSLARAVENNQRAIDIDPNLGWAHNDAGVALGLMAERAAARGADPIRFFTESAGRLDRAIELNKGDPTPHANQTWFYARRAEYELEYGVDPVASLDHAVKHAEAALLLRSDKYNCFSNLGLARGILARYRMQLGQDAAEPLAKSIEAFRSALGLSPADVEAKRGLGAAHLGVARGDLARGEDPEPALRAARQPLKEALAAAPSDAETHLVLGELELTAARAAIAARKSPERAFSTAEASLRRAHELNAASARPLAALAELHRERAAWALGARRAADRDIEEGLRRIARALEINATMPIYHALQASLLAQKARAARDDAARADLLRRARDELSAALKRNRFIAREYQPILADIEARIADAGSKPAR